MRSLSHRVCYDLLLSCRFEVGVRVEGYEVGGEKRHINSAFYIFLVTDKEAALPKLIADTQARSFRENTSSIEFLNFVGGRGEGSQCGGQALSVAGQVLCCLNCASYLDWWCLQEVHSNWRAPGLTQLWKCGMCFDSGINKIHFLNSSVQSDSEKHVKTHDQLLSARVGDHPISTWSKGALLEDPFQSTHYFPFLVPDRILQEGAKPRHLLEASFVRRGSRSQPGLRKAVWLQIQNKMGPSVSVRKIETRR